MGQEKYDIFKHDEVTKRGTTSGVCHRVLFGGGRQLHRTLFP